MLPLANLERLSAAEVKSLPVPEVSLISIFHPQHLATACSSGPQVHRQVEHIFSKHVVIEAESTVVVRLAIMVGGFEDWTEQHRRVFELPRGRCLNVEVVAIDSAQCVVLQRACVKGWSRALVDGPVKNIFSSLFLFPVTQPMFKVTLQLWSCDTWQREIHYRQNYNNKKQSTSCLCPFNCIYLPLRKLELSRLTLINIDKHTKSARISAAESTGHTWK